MSGELALSTGLLSGIDSNQLVQALTSRQEIPIKNQEKKTHELKIQKEELQSINSALFAVEDSLLQLSLNSTFNLKTADYTTENIVLASPTTEAEEGSYDINVTQLAKAHQIAGTKQDDAAAPINSEEATININGISLIVDANSTLNDIRDGLNALKDQTNVEASVIDGTLILTGTETGADSNIVAEDTDGSLLSQLGFFVSNDSSDIQPGDEVGELFTSGEITDFSASAGTINVNGIDVVLAGGEDLDAVATAINNALPGTFNAFVRDNKLNIAAEGASVALTDTVGNNAALLSGAELQTSQTFVENTYTATTEQVGLSGGSLWADSYGGFFGGRNYISLDDTPNATLNANFDEDDTIEINGTRYKFTSDSPQDPGGAFGTIAYLKNIDGTAIGSDLEASLDDPLAYTITDAYLDLNGKTLTINGTDVNFSVDHNAQEVADIINAAGISGVGAAINSNNQLELSSSAPITLAGTATTEINFTGSTTTSSTSDYYNSEDTTISVNGENINIQSYSTLEDIRDAINGASGTTGVSAIINSGQLDFTYDDTLFINDVGGDLAERLGIETQAATVLQEAQDASFTVNGLTVTRSTNSFDDVIDQVNLELQDTGSTTIDIGYDTDNARTKIEDFVEKFNSAIELTYNKLNAEKDYALKGLNKQELEELSPEEIEDREDALRGQALVGDSLVGRIYRSLRGISFERLTTDGSFSTLADLGISTGKIGSNKDETKVGKLKIVDEEKFLSALRNNMESVRKLFAQEDPEEVRGSTGLAERFKGDIQEYTAYNGLLTRKAGRADSSIFSSIDIQIANIESDILFKNRSLIKYQESLLSQFTNMETALADLQEQSSALVQASGGA